MLQERRTTAALLGVALLAFLGSAVFAQEEGPAAKDADQPAVAGDQQPGPPRLEGRRGFGPRGGRGPMRRDEARGFGPGQGRPPGMTPGGGPNRPDRPGSPGQMRPLRPGGHPGGPPRWPHHDWDAFEQRDPEMYKLLKDDHDMERQARELAVQYRRAPEEQRSEIKTRLAELVDRHFEVRQQRRQLELKRLEEELKRLRDAINQRKEARQEVVSRRVSELLGEGNVDF